MSEDDDDEFHVRPAYLCPVPDGDTDEEDIRSGVENNVCNDLSHAYGGATGEVDGADQNPGGDAGTSRTYGSTSECLAYAVLCSSTIKTVRALLKEYNRPVYGRKEVVTARLFLLLKAQKEKCGHDFEAMLCSSDLASVLSKQYDSLRGIGKWPVPPSCLELSKTESDYKARLKDGSSVVPREINGAKRILSERDSTDTTSAEKRIKTHTIDADRVAKNISKATVLDDDDDTLETDEVEWSSNSSSPSEFARLMLILRDHQEIQVL